MKVIRQKGVKTTFGWCHRYLLKNASGQQIADLGTPCQGITTQGEIVSRERGFESGLLAMAKALGHDKAIIETEEATCKERTEL